MTAKPEPGKDEESVETERDAASMQDQLSKEVASWSKERRERSGETVVAPAERVAQRRASRPAGEAKKASAPPVAAAEPAGARSKPFKMSYGGMTQAEYTEYLRAQGSR
jgi:cell division protein FtsN